MARRHNRTYIVGIFVAGTTAVLVIALLWLAGSRFFRPVDTYHVLFSGSVSGLLPGAAVELNGVNVGKVSSMHLTKDSPPKVDVGLEVAPGTPIRRDSVATLTGSLLTGIRFIQIRGGTEQAGPVPPGESLRVEEGGLDDIRRQATELTQEVHQILAALNEGVLSARNRQNFSRMLEDLAATGHNLRTITAGLSKPDNLAAFHQTMANFALASAQLRGTLSQLSGHTNMVSDKLVATLAQMDRTLALTQQLVTRASGVLDSNAVIFQQTLRRLDHTSERLDSTLEDIQYDPSILLWGTKVRSREMVK